MCGGEMVNVDGQPVARIGMQTQLNPIVCVVGVDAADFDPPGSTGRFELGAVEVDKKLIRVGYRRRDGTGEADFSDHAQQRCKFSTSVKHTIYGPIL